MLDIGKLPSELLERLVFDNIGFKREEVLIRPGIGEDCAVVDFGSYDCVLTADPITAAVKDIGSLSVHISCNDVAAKGVEPLGIMLVILMPKGSTEEDIKEIMAQAGNAAQELNVEIIGGHTEVTTAVTKPVIVSTALGRALKGKVQNPAQMEEGDLLYITKYAGLEGTGIIAKDREKELSDILNKEELAEAKSLLDLVSVVREGVILGKLGTHGMHDVTEGGILGAICEMCQIAGKGALIKADAIPVKEVTKKICDIFDIDYLRLISSGSMMVVLSPDVKEEAETAMKEASIIFTKIGTVTEKGMGIKLDVDGKIKEVEPPGADEIYKAV